MNSKRVNLRERERERERETAIERIKNEKEKCEIEK